MKLVLSYTKVFCLLFALNSSALSAQSIDSSFVNAVVYPNPFYSKLNIKHNKKTEVLTEVSIYDALGNLIYSFDKEDFKESVLVWNGSTFSGSTATSGTYICFIRTRKRTESILIQKQ